MYFQEDDLFLINRDSVSSTMEALTIKNIVNPVGTVEQPIIEQPTEQQGFPVQSSNIIRNNGSQGDTTLTLQVENLNNLELIGAEGVAISEAIASHEAYSPITTSINNVDDLGSNQYNLTFSAINYDINIFEVGETVKSLKGKTATIDSIDISLNSMVITSTSDWSDEIFGRLESQREIEATATLVKYETVNSKALCYLENVTGHWIDKYNNRNQRMVFDTTKPKGGSHVDLNNAVFVANEFEVDNPVLHLTDVIWRLNGREFNVPIVDKEAKQEWEVPPEAMIEDAVNVVTVTYIAGQNRATSERTEFIPKSNPIRLGNTVSLLNRIETFTTEVTALGL